MSFNNACQNWQRFEPEKLLYILKPIGHSDEEICKEMTTNQGLFVEDSYKNKEGNSKSTILNFMSMVLNMMVKFFG